MQKKRRLNDRIFKDYSSSYTQRRLALIHRVSRTTIARKIRFLGERARRRLEQINDDSQPVVVMEFDDMEKPNGDELNGHPVIDEEIAA